MYVPFSFSRFAPFVLVFGLLFHPRWCMHFTPPLDLLHTANCRTQCTTCTADSTYETTACTTSTNRVCSPVRSPCPLLPCPLFVLICGLLFIHVGALQTTIGSSSHCQLPFAVLHMHGGLHLRNHGVHCRHQQSVHQCELC
jgi:hypothetical protein